MSCEINYDRQGNIDHVTEDGKRSTVFDSLKEMFENPEKALDAYNLYRSGTDYGRKVNYDSYSKSQADISLGGDSILVPSEMEADLSIGKIRTIYKSSEIKASVWEAIKSNLIIIKDTTLPIEKRNQAKALNDGMEQSLGIKVKLGDKLNINTPLDVRREEEYVRTYSGNILVSEAKVTEGKVEYITTNNNYSGQGLGVNFLNILITDAIENSQQLVLPKTLVEDIKYDVIEELISSGILTSIGDNYVLEPKRQSLLRDITQVMSSDTNPMGVEYRPRLRNLLLRFNLNNLGELKNKLNQILSEGVMLFSQANLGKVFNVFEARKISKDLNEQENLKDIYNRLDSTEYEIEQYNNVFTKTESFGLLGGAQIVRNPYKEEQRILKLVAGVPNVLEVLPEEYHEDYHSNSEFKALIDNYSNNYGNLSKVKIQDENLVNNKGDIEGMLRNTIYPFSYTNGIDRDNIIGFMALVGLSPNVEITTDEQFNMADELLLALEERDYKSAAGLYEDLYALPTETELVRTNQPNADVILKTELSDTEVLERFSLLKMKGDVYRRVDTSGTVYDMLTENMSLNPNGLSLEDLYSEVLKDARQAIKSEYSEEALIKTYLYRRQEGGDINLTSTPSTYETKFNTTVPFEDYLKTDFIKDFNSEIINNGNTLFKVTSRGIEFTSTDQISIQDALDSLELSVRQDIINYSKVSKSMTEIVEDTTQDFRDMDEALDNLGLNTRLELIDPYEQDRLIAYNYPNSLKALPIENTVFTTLTGETTIVVRSEQSPYLNDNGRVLERVLNIGDISVYKEGPNVDEMFIVRDIPVVTMLSNASEFTALTQTSGTNSTESLFDRLKDRKEVENKYFDCR